MKNIHILPTSQPSKLATHYEKMRLIQTPDMWTYEFTKQNIYITSDEEIKDGDWVIWFGKHNQPFLKKVIGERDGEWLLSSTYDMWVEKDKPKKIILTTDQQLIKYGVQSIEDEFLIWFVKNPNCEYVQIEIDYKKFKKGNVTISSCYIITFPKEELTNKNNY